MPGEVYTIGIETTYRDAGAQAGLQNLTRSLTNASSAASSLQGWLSGAGGAGGGGGGGPAGLISRGGGFGRGMPGMPSQPFNWTNLARSRQATTPGGLNAISSQVTQVNRLSQAMTALQRSRTARIAVTGLESVQAASGAITGLISGLNALRFYAAMGVSAYAISQPYNIYAQRSRMTGQAAAIMRGNIGGAQQFTGRVNQMATQTGLGDDLRRAAMTMLGPAVNVRGQSGAAFTEQNLQQVATLALAYNMSPDSLAQLLADAMSGNRRFTYEQAQALEKAGIPIYDIIASGLNLQAQQAGQAGRANLTRVGVMAMLREGVLPGVATGQAVLNWANDPGVKAIAERNRNDAEGVKNQAISALSDIASQWGEAIAATVLGPLQQLAGGNIGKAIQYTLPQIGPINQGGTTGGGAIASTALWTLGAGLLLRRGERQVFGGIAAGRRVGQAAGIIARGRGVGRAAAALRGPNLTAGMTDTQVNMFKALQGRGNGGMGMSPEVAAAVARGDLTIAGGLNASQLMKGGLGVDESIAAAGARFAGTGATAASGLVGPTGAPLVAAARAAEPAATEAGRLGSLARLAGRMRGLGRVGKVAGVAGIALMGASLFGTRQAEAAGLEKPGATAQEGAEDVVSTAIPLGLGMVNPLLGLGAGGLFALDAAVGGGKLTHALGSTLAPMLSFLGPQQVDQMRDITNLNDPYIKQIQQATQALRDLTDACKKASTCMGRCGGSGGGPNLPPMPLIPAGPPQGSLGPGFNPTDPSTWPIIRPRGTPQPGTPQPGQPGLPGVLPPLVTTGDWADKARMVAKQAGIDPEIFVRQMSQESGGFAPDVISGQRKSGAGARGIAQFMPGTAAGVAKRMGVSLDQFWADPMLQLQGATMLDKDYPDWRDALVAYNGGPGRVALPNNQLPGETQDYLTKILGSTSANAPVAAPTVIAPVTMNNTFTNPADSPDTVAALSDKISTHIASNLGAIDNGVTPGPMLLGAPGA